MREECSTSEGACDTAGGECSEGSGKGSCPTDALPCPVDIAAKCWNQSFMRAMCDVQTDMLRARIKKEWGPQMEKVADAMFESHGEVWRSWVSMAKAKAGLRERMIEIFSERSK